MTNWRVSDQRSFSDHKWIFISLYLAVEASNTVTGPRRIDGRKFGQLIENRLAGAPNWNIDTTVRDLKKTCEITFKILYSAEHSKKTLLLWCNEESSSFRKLTREVSNICYSH